MLFHSYLLLTLSSVQDIQSSKAEGDYKIQELRRKGQTLEFVDIDEDKKQEVNKLVRDAEEKWARVLQETKQVLQRAEKQQALEEELKDYEMRRENTRMWLEEKQQSLVGLEIQRDPEKIIVAAQVRL